MSDTLAATAKTETEAPTMCGAEVIIQALIDQGVDTIFGYPGGAVLPIYDELYKQDKIKHILVRHEQGAVHAAEGYARSTGRVGVVLVTSGPGATNAVTGLADALLDSIPVVCLSGQVATHLIGNDAFQEADTVGITRPITKHNYLVKDRNRLAGIIHEAFYVARSGRPGPVVVDIPKDIQIAKAPYSRARDDHHRSYRPQMDGDPAAIKEAVERIARAKKPVFYAGGGIINAGPRAAELLTRFVHMTGAPITNTLMGLGGFPASDKQFLGMLGMHGSYEANMAMHDCDVMINLGARFDDRVTGALDKFSPGSFKIHVDIDRSSINKNVRVDLPIVGDCAHVLEAMIEEWEARGYAADAKAQESWWSEIEGWRGRNSFHYENRDDVIMPQYALERLYALTKDRDTYITTEVGQHQMWAAQFLKFEKPNHWMTSGGLGTMGYGLPAAIGVQEAHPDALVIDVAGEASIQMNIQEMSTALQHGLPVKIFILNNEYMGMVRQWQDLFYESRYAHSYSDALPDFVKLAEAFGALGLRADKPEELDAKIMEMIDTPRPVIFDCRVAKLANCYPMIPSGAAHNQMIFSDEDAAVGGGRADSAKAVV